MSKMITENHDGEKLVLDDGSEWEIEPGDIPTACLWLPTEEITIRHEGGSLWGYRLRRRSTGEVIYAMRC